MWTKQKLYEKGTGNQCTLSNININAWQIKKGKCVGDGGGNDYKFSMSHIEHGGKCLIIFD